MVFTCTTVLDRDTASGVRAVRYLGGLKGKSDRDAQAAGRPAGRLAHAGVAIV